MSKSMDLLSATSGIAPSHSLASGLYRRRGLAKRCLTAWTGKIHEYVQCGREIRELGGFAF